MFANGVQRVIKALRSRGFAGARRELSAFRGRKREKRRYEDWLARHGRLTERERAAMLDDIAKLEDLPLISIVLPVYNVEEEWLRLCLDSVRKQLYPNWQLCIADDASPSPHVKPILNEYAAADERIAAVFRETNGHISAASNSALETATGEFTVLLDHDDELSEDALYWVAKTIVEDKSVQMMYSDEDVIDETGRRFDPKFNPDFARDLVYSLNHVTHLSAYRTSLHNDVGGFRVGMEGSQDYDLALRVIERIDENQIRHIPRILYHWRAIETSVASSGEAKPYAYEKAREALTQHFERTGVAADVVPATHNLNRVRYRRPSPSQIAMIVHGGSTTLFDGPSAENISVIKDVATTPSALNAAVRKCSGETICFVDARLDPVNIEWLEELTSLAMQPKIGAVGGRIVSRTGDVRCVGFVVEAKDLVRATEAKASVFDAGYFFRAGLIGNFSAVSIACMAVRREAFDTIGGFDENFTSTLFDADLCLRFRANGFRILYTPYAELVETVPIQFDRVEAGDAEYFKQKWTGQLTSDPFYNPNLSTTDLFSIGD